MFYIYKYTNKINNKSYIGQTNNIRLRMNGHRSSANNINDHQYDTPFHRALRKYGEENFSFEILEEIDEELGRDYLNEREVFYIQKYKTYIRDGG